MVAQVSDARWLPSSLTHVADSRCTATGDSCSKEEEKEE